MHPFTVVAESIKFKTIKSLKPELGSGFSFYKRLRPNHNPSPRGNVYSREQGCRDWSLPGCGAEPRITKSEYFKVVSLSD